MTSEMAVTHFDPLLLVTVSTDASQLHGLGYTLGHYIDGRFWLLICGSKSLTPTQQQYATIELECLTVFLQLTSARFT